MQLSSKWSRQERLRQEWAQWGLLGRGRFPRELGSGQSLGKEKSQLDPELRDFSYHVVPHPRLGLRTIEEILCVKGMLLD